MRVLWHALTVTCPRVDTRCPISDRTGERSNGNNLDDTPTWPAHVKSPPLCESHIDGVEDGAENAAECTDDCKDWNFPDGENHALVAQSETDQTRSANVVDVEDVSRAKCETQCERESRHHRTREIVPQSFERKSGGCLLEAEQDSSERCPERGSHTSRGAARHEVAELRLMLEAAELQAAYHIRKHCTGVYERSLFANCEASRYTQCEPYHLHRTRDQVEHAWDSAPVEVRLHFGNAAARGNRRDERGKRCGYASVQDTRGKVREICGDKVSVKRMFRRRFNDDRMQPELESC
mmetsp:Transcript_11488/g.30393  ORF Transcript_11488/g.30393 Transcript_11488/m.30393 type:complete len:294 (-) Transcript_11488:301-1182(-)